MSDHRFVEKLKHCQLRPELKKQFFIQQEDLKITNVESFLAYKIKVFNKPDKTLPQNPDINDLIFGLDLAACYKFWPQQFLRKISSDSIPDSRPRTGYYQVKDPIDDPDSPLYKFRQDMLRQFIFMESQEQGRYDQYKSNLLFQHNLVNCNH